MKNFREDQDLMSVLEGGSLEDLSILIDIITDNGEGRLSLEETVKKSLINAKKSPHISSEIKTLIAEEIQRFGGNSFINLFRMGKGVIYKEIACDVASHVRADFNDKQDIGQIEAAILLRIVEQSLDKMSEDEKKQFFDQFGVKYEGVGPAAMIAMLAAMKLAGFATYRLAAIVANSMARAILGKGLTFVANNTLMKAVSVFTGPVGWAITGIWTAFDLASPAYRITVPCVIQIAYMRQKALSIECPACHAMQARGARFCSECKQELIASKEQS